MKRDLSVVEWHILAEEKTAPPVRIQLSGGSMAPLIRMNRDYITIVQLEEKPIVGDIVLFSPPENERYIVHRVWNIYEDKVQTWGDNCIGPDPWIPYEAVWGKVVLIEHGKRRIVPNPAKGLRWARLWHRVGKVYRFIKRIRDGVNRRIKKLRV